MTKLMVKCTRQVPTRHIFVRTISNFAKQISNVDIINFCKKNDENRILTVTVTSLLIIIFDPKWQGSWWNALGKPNAGSTFKNHGKLCWNDPMYHSYRFLQKKVSFCLPLWRHYWYKIANNSDFVASLAFLTPQATFL